jgi:hypothetical protein
MHLLQTDGNLHGVSMGCALGQSGRKMSAKKRKAWRNQAKKRRNGRFAIIQTVV